MESFEDTIIAALNGFELRGLSLTAESQTRRCELTLSRELRRSGGSFASEEKAAADLSIKAVGDTGYLCRQGVRHPCVVARQAVVFGERVPA